ncbi:hypothetical protein HK16_03040 [Acetobacter senegalensis]|uniref:Uncharacterized protein n=2 Tax=Acetobacter TaxID=434 RepID=A0A252EDV0_9PROT|nr:hypothetical protein CIW82_02825 [Acetobacter tropicalis]OUL64658.1 hypothetical protein HK16_03040 [Acetobacter senegalensis]
MFPLIDKNVLLWKQLLQNVVLLFGTRLPRLMAIKTVKQPGTETTRRAQRGKLSAEPATTP